MIDDFENIRKQQIEQLGKEEVLRRLSVKWVEQVSRFGYSYHFDWLGRPIIQLPPDIVAMQEIIWRVRPDLIIETGIARGGSLVFYASMLELLDGKSLVVGIDIELRKHNREAIEAHPMSGRIRMIEGSSVDPAVVEQVSALSAGAETVLVVLDSLHTHDHVRRELDLYSPMVTRGSYLVVFDTIIEFMPDDYFPERPWGKGDNPYTAVQDFLQSTDRFELDEEYENKLLISVSPGGYLQCVRD